MACLYGVSLKLLILNLGDRIISLCTVTLSLVGEEKVSQREKTKIAARSIGFSARYMRNLNEKKEFKLSLNTCFILSLNSQVSRAATTLEA